MELYNSLSRKLEAFVPQVEGKVSFYSCGPTVYNTVHIGNLRAFAFYDLLHRSLSWIGYEVTHVMNITDVDDKTIRRSRDEGVSLGELTRRYEESFFADLDALSVKRPQIVPRATESIGIMVELAETLLEKGLAYRSEDGSLYFSIERHKGYGQLVQLDKTELRAGAGGRQAADEYDKENVSDFALWKAWTEADGPVGWDTSLGRGRPGWHLECSAMAMANLGETIDLHAGGIDLLFPHHENEIAQAEGATGKPFVKYWVHNAHLLVAGKKMSKSLNNFYTYGDLKDKAGITGRELRLALLRVHYRKPLNFQMETAEDGAQRFATIEDVRASLARLDDFVATMQAKQGEAGELGEIGSALEKARQDFEAALRQDLNISGALAAMYDLIAAVNQASVSPIAAAKVLALLDSFDEVLAIMPAEAGLSEELEGLLAARITARQEKDWARSDAVRELFRLQGYDLKDGAEGQVWRKL